MKQSVEMEVSSEKAKKIAQNIEAEFTYIHSRSALRKYGYVFLSPLLVTLSIIHSLFIFAFLACCVLEPAVNPTVSGVSGVIRVVVLYDSSTGWTVFFVIAALLVSAANFLVLMVGVVWIVIISAILAVFIVVVLCLFLIYQDSSAGLQGIDCNCEQCDNEQSGRRRRRR